MKRWPALLIVAAFIAAAALPVAAGNGRGGGASLITIEGEVLEVRTLPGEGDLPVVAVALSAPGAPDGRITVLLAPGSVLDELGFEVAPGDAMRARIFPADGGPAKAHKVMNLSRSTMVRFRTLHMVPLWDGRGAWQGGNQGSPPGQGGGRQHRGGRGAGAGR